MPFGDGSAMENVRVSRDAEPQRSEPLPKIAAIAIDSQPHGRILG